MQTAAGGPTTEQAEDAANEAEPMSIDPPATSQQAPTVTSAQQPSTVEAPPAAPPSQPDATNVTL